MSEETDKKSALEVQLNPEASGMPGAPPIVRGSPSALVSVSGSPSQLDLHVRAANHGGDVQLGTLTVSIRQPDGSVLQERFIRAGLIRAANALGAAVDELPMANTIDVVMLDGGSGDVGLSDFAGDDQMITVDVSADELPSLLRERRSEVTLSGTDPASKAPHAPFDASAWDDEQTEIAQPNAMPLDWQNDSWPNGTDLRTAHARYVLVGTLGISNLSESHLAYEILPAVLPRAVAVERLLASADVNWSARRARYVRRARIGSRLRHPNLVRVTGQGELRGIPFLVHEVIDGLNLRSLAAFAEREISATVACEIGRQVSEALAHIHSASDEAGEPLNLIHGEISPATISIGRDGVVRLSEAGCSRMSELVYEGSACPEQARGAPIDPRADFFSLGVTIVELLSATSLAPTGKLDFGGLNQRIESLLRARADIPESLVTLLMSLTAIEPDRRPSRVDTILAFFEEALERLGGSPDLGVELSEVFSRATPGASATAASSAGVRRALPVVTGTPEPGAPRPVTGDLQSASPALHNEPTGPDGRPSQARTSSRPTSSRPSSALTRTRRATREFAGERTPIAAAGPSAAAGGSAASRSSRRVGSSDAVPRSILDDDASPSSASPATPWHKTPLGVGAMVLGLICAIGLGALLSWVSL